MLIDTFVYSLYFTFPLPLLFHSVLSTERLSKRLLYYKRTIYVDVIIWDQYQLLGTDPYIKLPYNFNKTPPYITRHCYIETIQEVQLKTPGCKIRI